MTKWKSLKSIALVGALFASTLAMANQARQVVSENGKTSTVERIDFPGLIKDVIPAGDKYLIHADPIASLKDSVAVDGLFVMEKDNTGSAFGRTFSTNIHSVAYVPGLDIATWSYEDIYSAKLLNVKTGSSALASAGSITGFDGWEFDPKSKLFGLDGNRVIEIRTDNEDGKLNVFGGCHILTQTENGYEDYPPDRSHLIGEQDAEKVIAADEYGVFVASSDKPNRLVHYRDDSFKNRDTINDWEFPLNMAKLSSSPTDGRLFVENSPGNVQSRSYDANNVGDVDGSTVAWNGLPISSMATSKSNDVLRVVSKGTNEVFESNATLTNTDRVIPNPSEKGYRKIIADGNDTLLLSDTNSNYFYRVRSR